MRKRRIVLSAVFTAAVVLYLLSDTDFAAFMAAVAVIYTVVAKLSMTLMKGGINVRFSTGAEGAEGENREIRFTIENTGAVPVLLCDAEITAENILTGVKKTIDKKFSLMPKQKKETGFSIADECCGDVNIKLNRLTVSDPLGIFEKETETDPGSETDYMVLPVISGLSVGHDQLDRYDMESYKYSQKQKGSDPSETFGIKNYAEGDSIKSIHWKLSGKVGDIVVREYGLPVDNRIFVICDRRVTGEEELPPEEKSRLTEFYLSVLYTLAKQGLHHSTGWYDYRRNEFVNEQIAGEEDVYRIVPHILQSPFGTDKISSADRFIEADTEKDYACYIYVTPDGRDADGDTERLRNYGEVNIYRPGNKEQ